MLPESHSGTLSGRRFHHLHALFSDEVGLRLPQSLFVDTDDIAKISEQLLFLLNLIGFGIGPQLVGILSDLFEPAWGHESIRYALLGVGMCKAWGSLHSLLAARHLRAELAAARAS